MKTTATPKWSTTPIPVTVERGAYDELVCRVSREQRLIGIPSLADVVGPVGKAVALVRELSGGSDEHGAWTTGIESDRKRRGTSVNADLYGVATWRRRVYAVVQVRESRFRPNRYTKVRKDYYLCGRNENGRPFAHPVSYAPIRAAIRKDPGDLAAPVLAAMAWIWGCPVAALRDVARNGDTALVPIARLPHGCAAIGGGRAHVVDSHTVEAAEFATDGAVVFARCGTLRHGRGQHPDARLDGWARVVIGRRERTWDFTAPTAD